MFLMPSPKSRPSHPSPRSALTSAPLTTPSSGTCTAAPPTSTQRISSWSRISRRLATKRECGTTSTASQQWRRSKRMRTATNVDSMLSSRPPPPSPSWRAALSPKSASASTTLLMPTRTSVKHSIGASNIAALLSST
ncbi:hypothetical protein BC939DRAFT_103014 [Gamsiella multidivaricata]|uniref:uncharacterized protein n=1 Tax=Gamsiella multidivaricata TaxID=101098 RepID=UPI0022204656|nr:uncharacterized protein BC939DRAFT_103014 [Gamsiella multidivaricata]KAI7832401.1 hypothetical protein BC939DRAFT_103014 [Gamsiella multidivaricata]